MGFGFPVVIFKDKTYFAGSARVFINAAEKRVSKHFVMDMVSRKILGRNVRVDTFGPYQLVAKSLANRYRDTPSSRKYIVPLMVLRNLLGIQSHFMRVACRGIIRVHYRVRMGEVRIEADWTGLATKQLEMVVLMNEQGSTFFRVYRDADGLCLSDDGIGAWDPVTAD
jgi:hypothetical protein